MTQSQTSQTSQTSQSSPEIGKYVMAGGVKTNYLEAGSGEPVILIHGSGPGVSAYANWRLAMPYLAEKLHVFAYDQMGFGYTEPPSDNQYSLQRWTNQLVDFMNAVGVKRACMVGNSMGASVAIAAAVEHPDMVSRLVLMGPMGVRFPISYGLREVWDYQPSVENMMHLLHLFIYNQSFITNELAELRYKASIRQGMQEAFSSLFPHPRQKGVDELAAYQGRLGEVQAPTMLIHGLEDLVIPVQTSQILLTMLPNAQMHIFAHCGHWSQIEWSQPFNWLVRGFFTGEAGSGPVQEQGQRQGK